MISRIKSAPLVLGVVIASLLTHQEPLNASELSSEQEKFLGYMGHSWCIMEKNGLGNDYLSEKVRLYSGMKGDVLGEWTEFATRFESVYVADQIAMAMLPSHCKSVDFRSQHWKNASRMMDRMKSTPSYGFPPPPTAGNEKAWVRRWCSIGWRNYGSAHIDRCIKLSDKHM